MGAAEELLFSVEGNLSKGGATACVDLDLVRIVVTCAGAGADPELEVLDSVSFTQVDVDIDTVRGVIGSGNAVGNAGR